VSRVDHRNKESTCSDRDNPLLHTTAELENWIAVVEACPDIRTTLDTLDPFIDFDRVRLLLGETGVGKEVLARYLHAKSTRAAGPFVSVNCGAIPEERFEAELFGWELGAFPDALCANLGRFRLAEGGTIFLDEIGDTPVHRQVKILKVLEDREVWPVGALRPYRINCRIVAGTNADVKRQSELGRFREDLYYRLHVVAVTVPPLRNRRRDIPVLVNRFIERASSEIGTTPPRITQEAMGLIIAHKWPGNVRQLENEISKAVYACVNGQITREVLQPWLEEHGPTPCTLREAVAQCEKDLIEATQLVTPTNGATAAQLGICETTLKDKIKNYGIKTPPRGARKMGGMLTS